jgi:hypothetical protein
VVCLQEVSRAFLAYAFGGVLPKDSADTKPTPDQAAEIKASSKALFDLYECVWARRTFAPGVVPKHGPKPDGPAIMYSRQKFAPPRYVGSKDDEKTVLSALVDVEDGKPQPPVQITSPFAATHFRTLKSEQDPRNSIAVALRTHNGVPVGTFVSLHLEGAQNTEGKLDMLTLRAAQLEEAAAGAAALNPTVKSPFTVVFGDFNDESIVAMMPAVEKKYNLKFVPIENKDPHAVPADAWTSIYGTIDHLLMSDPTRLVGQIEIYPKPKDRMKNPAGMTVARNGARSSPYLAPPYLNPTWPSDHVLLLAKVVSFSG